MTDYGQGAEQTRHGEAHTGLPPGKLAVVSRALPEEPAGLPGSEAGIEGRSGARVDGPRTDRIGGTFIHPCRLGCGFF